ncbi:hypothetical protein BGW36DRAFT_400515 [Talaromyces proteolyticus]|uniref:Uncharacterized protein n=1 Tax=Talaromyces proteolyticus TaxID=1131652 RepID=A0AAD4KFY8_9EURO|nr:uncharacterized protein BGW36DRAFT_400515 [Talaromyces proteolyticus]KAH8691169.1 hypothetical protein BGW36DRAFT_400515 [Talaromyces proteolyticus]
MFNFLALCIWVTQSFAANSTAVEGWQFDGNSRSTFDILWSCSSTIFACTWTALHTNVPERNKSDFQIGVRKAWQFFFALMAPELIAWTAAQELWPCQRAIPPAQAYDHRDLIISPSHTKWTFAQSLQTEDEWLYIIDSKLMLALIKADIVRCSDLRDRDIKDRAKADSLAKAFTVLQSTWAVINVVARAGYKLPISLIELSTVAYVICGLLTYAFWWHKPKDMTTPIMINLRYTRDNLPQEIRNITDENPQKWVHWREVPPEENFFAMPQIIRRVHRRVFTEKTFREVADTGSQAFTRREEAALDAFAILAAILFCCVHIAAWNFLFPTQTEQIAWRIFTLIAVSMACVAYLVGQAPLFARLLAKIISIPSCMKALVDPTASFTMLEIYLNVGAYQVYCVARLGIFALMLSSLRALPVGCYISIDWLASIPHL